jgi:cytochrome c oxidase assembly protein subunit 15
MNTPDLYNLSPLAMVMLAGLVIAIVPLVWVWWRHRGQGAASLSHGLAVLTLFLTFDLVLFGAFTRLTDSGLGCPDWPGCYGSASPLGAASPIAAAQAALPSGPVTYGKAWIEMVHRYLATAVGVLILFQAIRSWYLYRQGRRAGGAWAAPLFSPWWSTLTLIWVCLQGAFGALTVTMKLFPAIVTLHLLGGIVLLMLLAVQVAQGEQSRQVSPATAKFVGVGRGLRFGLMAGLGLLTVQIALGGWVSTNYAVLACAEFPTCQGGWWPPMNVSQGFEIWRPLGMTSQGEIISFAALTAIHWVHRLMALVVFAALGALTYRLRSYADLKTTARWLALLLLLQFATGVSNVVFEWPLLAAVLHTGGAAALCVVLTLALTRLMLATAAFDRASSTSVLKSSSSENRPV